SLSTGLGYSSVSGRIAPGTGLNYSYGYGRNAPFRLFVRVRNKHSKTCHVITEGKQLVFPTTPTIFTIQTPEFESYASLQARKNTPSEVLQKLKCLVSFSKMETSEPDVSLQLLGMSGYQNRCLRDSGLGSCSNNTSPKYMNIEGTDNNYRNFDVSNSEDSPSSSDSEDISFHCQKEHLTLNRYEIINLTDLASNVHI
ncbi:hypothetical protein LSH36_44g15037, partial [Paralvinella palmiformis]